MRRGGALGAATILLAALAGGGAGAASAAGATVTIESPPAGGVTDQSMPTFSGTTSGGEVTVTVYSGISLPGPVAEIIGPVQPHGGAWSATAALGLADGAYTAQAVSGGGGVSEPVPFTIVTASPAVSLDPVESPRRSDPTFTGAAGVAPGDERTVTLELYAGESPAGSPFWSAKAAVSGGRWAYAGPPLFDGTYTARAVQGDSIGNPPGVSAPQTFTIDSSPPAAAFVWAPPSPYAGEAVSLASTSTDAVSPITAFAWDLAGGGPFQSGGPVISTSFPAPGSYLVRMRATDASGLSSVAARTIVVRARPAPVMVPFPIVRIVGASRRRGAAIRLLAVEAPAGARASVSCRGRGCPVRSLLRVVPRTRAGTAWVYFRRFERFLPAGVVLAIRVSRSGEIGAYTSFAIRRGRLPRRVDECLDPRGLAPIACTP